MFYHSHAKHQEVSDSEGLHESKSCDFDMPCFDQHTQLYIQASDFARASCWAICQAFACCVAWCRSDSNCQRHDKCCPSESRSHASGWGVGELGSWGLILPRPAFGNAVPWLKDQRNRLALWRTAGLRQSEKTPVPGRQGGEAEQIFREAYQAEAGPERS